MKSALLLLLALIGCQRGETDPGTPTKAPPAKVAEPVTATGPDYAADIAALCDSVSRSGADKVEADARALTIANWLGSNLKTAESRRFLVQIQPLGGEPKATALEAEAHRVGLDGCALAAEWRTPRQQ